MVGIPARLAHPVVHLEEPVPGSLASAVVPQILLAMEEAVLQNRQDAFAARTLQGVGEVFHTDAVGVAETRLVEEASRAVPVGGAQAVAGETVSAAGAGAAGRRFHDYPFAAAEARVENHPCDLDHGVPPSPSPSPSLYFAAVCWVDLLEIRQALMVEGVHREQPESEEHLQLGRWARTVGRAVAGE